MIGAVPVAVAVADAGIALVRFLDEGLALDSVELGPLRNPEPILRLLRLTKLLLDDLGGDVLLPRRHVRGQPEGGERVRVEEMDVGVALRVDHVVAEIRVPYLKASKIRVKNLTQIIGTRT